MAPEMDPKLQEQDEVGDHKTDNGNETHLDATHKDYWPPRRPDYNFNWDLPTNENYDFGQQLMFQKTFEKARSRLDYEYHKNPILERQKFQDAILEQVLENVSSSSSSTSASSRPWIVFTAGPMGVGKSYVMSQLYQRKLFPLDKFVKIDPDMLKSELPEMAGYLKHSPAEAATLLHRESTQMSDVLLEQALLEEHSILVDGSLRDVEFYKSFFQRLLQDYGNYGIAILYVSASDETIRNRAKARAETTGRTVPEKLLQASIDQVPQSVNALAPLTHVTFEIVNNDDQPLELKLRKPYSADVNEESSSLMLNEPTASSWQKFKNVWVGKHGNDDCDGQEEKQKEDDNEQKEEDEFTPMICNMRASFMDPEQHDLANDIWGAAYPSFCARCALHCDGQCGICIHDTHVCACKRCNRRSSVCPVSLRPPKKETTTRHSLQIF